MTQLKAVECKYCKGGGQSYHACSCGEPTAEGCEDCVDLCHFCGGFGVVYPKGHVMPDEWELNEQ